MLLASDVSAQVGNTGGPVLDYESQLVCWNNSGSDSTLVRVSLYQVGQSTPVTVTYHSLDGSSVDISGDVVTLGACAGDVTPTIAGIDYLMIELCDSGTPFYRLRRIEESNNNTTDVGDFGMDFSAYTVSGTVTTGPCVTSFEAQLTVSTINQTAGSIPAGKQSVSICNVGIDDVALTVDGTLSTLYPGACFKYAAYVDPTTKIFFRSPLISWDNASRVFVSYAD
ncbi:MAG: hypothetical protein AAFP08_11945 [Bacteroidota bacterium]